MIQRVQSVWLFLASLTIFLLLLLPIVSNQINGSEFWIMVTGLYQKTNETAIKVESFRPLYISAAAVALICFVSIFAFRNRTVQKRIIMAVMVLIVFLSYWIFNYAQKIPGGIDSASYGIGAFLPVIAVLFCALALRGIRKDEQLLKSADRLR
jgi:lipopolysaccharide export LptBFGC system permease protein LptF